jgi:hypothetical protein
VGAARSNNPIRDENGSCLDARVWLGIHFRFADTASRDLGVRLADSTLHHYFQRVDEHEESWSIRQALAVMVVTGSPQRRCT